MRIDLPIAVMLAALASVASPERAAAQAAADQGGPAPVVATAAGPVAGRREGAVTVFRSIPYAAPPVGELRWSAPRAPAPWTEVRPADGPTRACIQKPGVSEANGGSPGEISEDCLYLDVWTPRPATDARLPVLVWIHGGALVFGSGHVPVYDGAALAGRQAVVVTINYRLGPLGFFVHPSLGNHRPGRDANFGMLDQIAALRWVRENIAVFGGDPSRVTIFGQSAGAQSVLALFASPAARGLFARGIAQSPYGVPGHGSTKAKENGLAVAKALGLDGPKATAAALRAVPAESFAGLDGPGLSLAPSFILGDKALPRGILAAFQRGEEARLPLIIGSTSDDSSVATAFGIDPAALVKKLGAARIAVRPLYPQVADDAELGRQVVRDVVFTTFARRIAWLHAARAPTWRYYFDYVPEGLRTASPGAGHGAEIAFTMGNAGHCKCLGAEATTADREATQRIADRWSAFAAGGKPQAADPPTWAGDGRGSPRVMVFGPEGDASSADFMTARLTAFTVMLDLLDRVAPARRTEGTR